MESTINSLFEDNKTLKAKTDELEVEKEDAEREHAHILETSLQNADRQIEQAKADARKEIGEDLKKILLNTDIKHSTARCRAITDYVADKLMPEDRK